MSLLEEIEGDDAIMLPGIEETVEKLIDNGITENDVIIKLSSGYRGIPHLIKIVTNLLQKFNVESKNELVRRSKQYVTDLLFTQPQQMDSILRQFDAPPHWIETLIKEEQWNDAIFSAIEKYPRSFLLAYCVNQIFDTKPEIAKPLPVGVTRYEVFMKVASIALENNDIPKYISLICTDDMTFAFGIFLAKAQNNSALVSAIQSSLAQGSKEYALFNNLLMKLETSSNDLNGTNINQDSIHDNEIEEFAVSENSSLYVRETECQKIINSLFDRSISDEKIMKLLATLHRIAKTEREQVEVVNEAVKDARKWMFLTPQSRIYIIHAVSTRFFAVAIIHELEKRCKSNEPFLATENKHSPEANMLCEIIWCWPDLRTTVLSIATDLISRMSILEDKKAKALMQVCLCLCQHGYIVEILDHMALNNQLGCDKAILRQFMKVMFSFIRPPCSQELYRSILGFLKNQSISQLYKQPRGMSGIDLYIETSQNIVKFFNSIKILDSDLPTELLNPFRVIYNEVSEVASRQVSRPSSNTTYKQTTSLARFR